MEVHWQSSPIENYTLIDSVFRQSSSLRFGRRRLVSSKLNTAVDPIANPTKSEFVYPYLLVVCHGISTLSPILALLGHERTAQKKHPVKLYTISERVPVLSCNHFGIRSFRHGNDPKLLPPTQVGKLASSTIYSPSLTIYSPSQTPNNCCLPQLRCLVISPTLPGGTEWPPHRPSPRAKPQAPPQDLWGLWECLSRSVQGVEKGWQPAWMGVSQK